MTNPPRSRGSNKTAYTGTWNASTLGILDDNGYEISFSPKGQDINDTDQFGMTLIEGIYRGQDWRIRFRSKEFGSAGLLKLLLAWGSIAVVAPAPQAQLGTIGVTYSSLAKVLVLTVTAGTPAAGNPTSITASLSMNSPNNNISFLMTSKVRETPIETICLPYSDGAGHNVPFVAA